MRTHVGRQQDGGSPADKRAPRRRPRGRCAPLLSSPSTTRSPVTRSGPAPRPPTWPSPGRPACPCSPGSWSPRRPPAGRTTALASPAAVEQLQEAVAAAGLTGSPLVARSSSTVEDAGESSMAGQFTSMLDLRGWDALAAAVVEVSQLRRPRRPRRRAHRRARAAVPAHHPQRRALRRRPRAPRRRPPGGGHHRRRADQLVSGAVDGDTTVLTRRGRQVAGDPPDLRRRDRRRRTGSWRCASSALRRAAGHRVGHRRRRHPAPAAEPAHHHPGVATATGPPPRPRAGGRDVPRRARAPWSEDLWVPPLHCGLAEALSLSGSVGGRALRALPGGHTVGGQVAVDLDLLERHARPGPRAASTPCRPPGACGRPGGSGACGPPCRCWPPTWSREVDTDLAEVPPLDQLDRPAAAGRRAAAAAKPSPRCTATRCWPGLLLDTASERGHRRRPRACRRWPRAGPRAATTSSSSPPARSCSAWCPPPWARRRPLPADAGRRPRRRGAPATPRTRRRWPARRCGCGCAGCRS